MDGSRDVLQTRGTQEARATGGVAARVLVLRVEGCGF